MNDFLFTFLWISQGGLWLQLGNSAAGGGETAATEAVTKPAGMFDNMIYFLPMMLGVMLVMMLFSGRPQQKEQQRLDKLLSSLKKNDRVVTAGGIVGSIVTSSADSKFVTIRIDESNNTKIQVMKSSIIRVLDDEKAGVDAG